MKSEQVIQRLSTTPEASIENLQEHRYWLQCERAYTAADLSNGRSADGN